jgi:HEAT repeat protein
MRESSMQHAQPSLSNHQPSIDLLVDALASTDYSARRHALKALIRRGTIAVDALIGLLKSSSEQVRWEAAKALGRIGGPESTDALAALLDDESPDVRWRAADGLISIGGDALIPVLRSLIARPASPLSREASSHVLRAFLNQEFADIVFPVHAALEVGLPVEEVVVAAHEALNRLRDSRRRRFLTH